jgi:hypothetical protein
MLWLLLAPLAAAPQGPAATPHWALVAPVRPQSPDGGDTDLDALLAEQHAARGLTATGEADRATLLRRLSFDLIGLPPTPAELQQFLDDPAADAYEAQVDRLLASPCFGERWAVPWLDLARYGDSDGFNFDRARPIWPFRDWLVDSLNRDLPFDRFTAEVLAGDLLPDADEQTRIATGFHRNTMHNDEGGVDADEARWERLLDRAGTTATVWLGLTFHCAQCHDHKYDPIRQRDFYALVAFFEPQDEVVLQRAADGQRTLVLQERHGAAATTRLRLRGAYDQPGDEVAAATPAALHPWPEGAPVNRLGLARWLTAADNPLVARVYVNRVWDALFGTPLVDPPDDFGRQTAAPPLLPVLDWLATEFVRVGRRPKALLRTLVVSQAYRRSATADATHLARDPDNRLLARGARFRLDAERLRDGMLAAAGLLSLRRGGPPVFPLQADTRGVVPTNKVDLRWPTSDGDDRWRRGLYTYVRRTAPFVAAAVFDAPSREVCMARRQRTNSPLQALTALNDPAAVAAAEALGARMAGAPGDDRARLTFGFLLCTGRRPDAGELELLAAALAAEPPEVRWQRLASTLLNLDETQCRG